MNQGFLPVCRKDMEERGWDAVDFAYVIGDAYVDHPSFGTAGDHQPDSGGKWIPGGNHFPAGLER